MKRMRPAPAPAGRTLFLVGAYTIGKERVGWSYIGMYGGGFVYDDHIFITYVQVVLGVAQHCPQIGLIHVSSERLATLKCLDLFKCVLCCHVHSFPACILITRCVCV